MKVVLGSSAKAEELQTYKKIAGIEGLIDGETSSEDAEKSKPHPDVFQAAMAKLKASTRRKSLLSATHTTMPKLPARSV